MFDYVNATIVDGKILFRRYFMMAYLVICPSEIASVALAKAYTSGTAGL